MRRIRSFRSFLLSPPNQAKARVLGPQAASNPGLRLMRVDDHQSGRSTKDGMAMVAG